MKAVAVIGNPKPGSRTRAAAELLAAGLGVAPDDLEVVELSALGPGLLGWGDPEVAAAVATVAGADLVVVASPTFKASYTGLLKLFLDQFAGGTGLAGVVAVPLMLGGSPAHQLAAELCLRPVPAELGVTCPTAALYLLDSSYGDDGVLPAFVERWGDTIQRLTKEPAA